MPGLQDLRNDVSILASGIFGGCCYYTGLDQHFFAGWAMGLVQGVGLYRWELEIAVLIWLCGLAAGRKCCDPCGAPSRQ